MLITPAYTPEGGDADLERWDALADGLRAGGVEGFVAAYGDPACPTRGATRSSRCCASGSPRTSTPRPSPTRCTPSRARAPFEDWAELRELELPAVVVASRDEADPGHPYAVGERYAARSRTPSCVTEEPGASPLAWQGGQLSKVIAELGARAAS